MKETNPFFLTKVILFTPLRSAGAIFWGSGVRFLGCDFWGAISGVRFLGCDFLGCDFWGAISGVRYLGCLGCSWGLYNATFNPFNWHPSLVP
jgi:hypothetical protein